VRRLSRRYERKYAVYGPPTTAQLEVEVQDTPDMLRGMVTTVGCCQGVGPAPVSTVTPPRADCAAVLPTAAQVPREGHEMSNSVATADGTGSEVQVAPPSELARIRP
jgi:hypothetical protein